MELYDVLHHDELHYLKLKQRESYVELLYIDAYLTTKVDRPTIDLTDMYLLKTKELYVTVKHVKGMRRK